METRHLYLNLIGPPFAVREGCTRYTERRKTKRSCKEGKVLWYLTGGGGGGGFKLNKTIEKTGASLNIFPLQGTSTRYIFYS
jgi:hypothetical protein